MDKQFGEPVKFSYSSGGERNPVAKTKFFFVTDVHGSDLAFRKFINAGKFYNVNMLILGGDITGKMIVLIVRQNDGSYKCEYGNYKLTMTSQEEVEKVSKTIGDAGFYPHVTEQKEFEELNEDPKLVKDLFTRLMAEGVASWLRLAEERLRGTGIKCYISPGNDDAFEIDSVLDSSSYVINPEGKVVDIDGGHEMITLGYTNHTPWHSPREVDEDVLQTKIEAMADKLARPEDSIFNIHVPPIRTQIDEAPKIDENLRIVTAGGGVVMISAGSEATRKAIEKYQPMMGIHGHIHESVGMVGIGRTMCFNPGSEYSQGILRGLLCEIEGSKIKSYALTSG